LGLGSRSKKEIAGMGEQGGIPVPPAPKLTPRLPKKPEDPADRGAEYRRMGIAYSIPTALVGPIAVLTLGGLWLDGRLDSAPTATIVGALLGIVIGFRNMIRLASRLNKD
jgi:F0F1-type ATP synthase assembly protein I